MNLVFMPVLFLFFTSWNFVTADLNALRLTLNGLKPQMLNMKVLLSQTVRGVSSRSSSPLDVPVP